jgi:hypothetical protein
MSLARPSRYRACARRSGPTTTTVATEVSGSGSGGQQRCPEQGIDQGALAALGLAEYEDPGMPELGPDDRVGERCAALGGEQRVA